MNAEAAAAAAEAAREREEELTGRLDVALHALDEAETRLVEMRQWEEAEAAWARDREASRRREEGLGAAREDAEAARERAEVRAQEALSELGKRDGEKQVCVCVLCVSVCTAVFRTEAPHV